MPLGPGTAATHAVYTGKTGARKNPMGLVAGIGIALVAVVAVTLVSRRGGNDETPVETTLAAVAADGWRNFTAPDGSFTAAFPGMPQRAEDTVGSLNELGQKYSIKQGDFEFGVIVTGAPAYVAPHAAGPKLEQWNRANAEGVGATIEGAGQVLTPRGDQAYDIVFVVGGTRWWNRFTTWGGKLVRVYASLPADQHPTGAQSAIHSRMRDSIRQ
jgi:hypothetical protein